MLLLALFSCVWVSEDKHDARVGPLRTIDLVARSVESEWDRCAQPDIAVRASVGPHLIGRLATVVVTLDGSTVFDVEVLIELEGERGSISALGPGSVYPGVSEQSALVLTVRIDGSEDEAVLDAVMVPVLPPRFEDLDQDDYGTSASGVCDFAGALVAGDCDDGNSLVHPGAADDVCNGVDDDCDGDVDEDVTGIVFVDSDGDGFGGATEEMGCVGPGLSASNDDCDDTNALVSPGGTEIVGSDTDEDCDGEGLCAIDLDLDGFTAEDALSVPASDLPFVVCMSPTAETDCDDAVVETSPDGIEFLCDGIDNDCDGLIDDADIDSVFPRYGDGDGDGFGDPNSPTCDPSGSTDNTDCDDTATNVNPDATELCDPVDSNCNGLAGDVTTSARVGRLDVAGVAVTSHPTLSAALTDFPTLGTTFYLCGNVSWPGTDPGMVTVDGDLVLEGIDERVGLTGRMEITGTGEVTVERVTWTAVATEDDGGLVNVEDATLRVIDSHLSGGSAPHGGAIYARDATVELTDVVLTGNVATNFGGGIYLAGSDLILRASTQEVVLSGNEAAIQGGALIVLGGSVSIEAGAGLMVRIVDNTSPVGAGMYTSQGALVQGEGLDVAGNLGGNAALVMNGAADVLDCIGCTLGDNGSTDLLVNSMFYDFDSLPADYLCNGSAGCP